ncbi:MAG: R3H domain-containing nucleic acid-binding protein [Acidobacteriota bacterium]|nr:R3H domain-containing nucleic acid-binding protein [Acidobacteriota bacterium]
MTQPNPALADDLDLLLKVMPPGMRATLETEAGQDLLIEVILDLGRIPEARFPERVVDLSGEAVTRQDLGYVVERVGSFGKDNRAGIERTLHRISAIRNRVGDVVGLTCRVGRAVVGTVDIVRDVIEAGRSILLLGRPGVGKTTLLREAARVLADDLNKRVVVVDTSNEIAGDGDVPHPGIGRARRMQVPSPDRQHAVMIEAVENHMPEVIVIDEIGAEAEALAARTIAERGVQLIATAHGNSLENLLQNPTLSDLVGGIHAVTLSDEEARRRSTQKTVLERKAPPTFDIVVEIQDQDQLAVHKDVAEVVDRMLRGNILRPQVRTRGESGDVEIQETMADEAPLLQIHENGAVRKPKRLRIFPYAVSRGKLQRAVRDLKVPVRLVDLLREADLILTLKSQERRQPNRLRDAQMRGVRLAVIKSNTVKQMENFLRDEFDVQDFAVEHEVALQQAERGIAEVMGSGHPVELQPQDPNLRRLQHEMVHDAGLASDSKGREPYRRVVIYPD